MSDYPSRVPEQIVFDDLGPEVEGFFKELGIVAPTIIFDLADSGQVGDGNGIDESEAPAATDSNPVYFSHVYELTTPTAEHDSNLAEIKLIVIEQIDQDGKSINMFYSLMAPGLGIAYIEIGARSTRENINRVAKSMLHAQNETLKHHPVGSPLVIAENINNLIVPRDKGIIRELDEVRYRPELKELFIIFDNFMLQPEHRTESGPRLIESAALTILIYVLSKLERGKAKVSIKKGLNATQAVVTATEMAASYQ